MDEYKSLRHSKWECKYYVIFIPKCRRKTLYGQLRRYLGEVFRKLARQKESRIEEGHLMIDHVHMLVSVPPKYAVSQVAGYISVPCDHTLKRSYALFRVSLILNDWLSQFKRKHKPMVIHPQVHTTPQIREEIKA